MNEGINVMPIWIPKCIESYEDAQIVCIHGADLEFISKEVYSALFFLKIYRTVESYIDDHENLAETISQYMPGIHVAPEFEVQDIAMKIIESENFYYGFPEFKDEIIECIDIESLDENHELYEELCPIIDDSLSLNQLLECNNTLLNKFKCEHDESKYDRDFSLYLVK